jgi:hypothetical protein
VFIGTVNVWRLRHFRWPILRIFARDSVHHLELAHYMNDLLKTGSWDMVRVAPHRGDDGRLSDHLYDVYGRPKPQRQLGSQPGSSRLGGAAFWTMDGPASAGGATSITRLTGSV